ncbi:hypothetical protein Gpo141_00006930 [Globisporangium polare]
MSTGSNDTTQELTLDAIGACSPVRKGGGRHLFHPSRGQSSRGAPSSSSHSPDSQRRSVLSLDDLSNEGKRDDDEHDDAERPGGSTRRVEEKLQLNLKQQQEHYARQRKLFEDLRSDAIAAPVSVAADATVTGDGAAHISPSVFSSSSRDSSDSDHNAVAENNDSSNPRRAQRRHRSQQQEEAKSPSATRFQSELESELTGMTLKRQAPSSSSINTDDLRSQHKKKMRDYRNDKDALRELSRIKAKAISDYERRMAETQQKQSRRLRPSVLPLSSPPAAKTGKALRQHQQPTDPIEELSQQEASNEALRKQLELLRRLQVENNRFRQDFRACREQNEALEEQNKTQKRELKRLREDVKDLALKVEQDQQSLAVAAQTSRKFKSCQKQLSAAQQEIEKLQTALHETLELQEQSQAKAIGEMSELATESKRLKRSLKQIKQQEAKVSDENELLRNTIEALESETNQLKSDLRTQKRENSELSSQIGEKASQCDVIEASATACVQRMETGMEALQKAFDAEREKRKKLESQRSSLQTHIDKLESESHVKQQQNDKLEHHVTQLQERLKDRKLALQQQKQSSDEYVEELLEKQNLDAKMIATLRGDCASVEQQLETERMNVLGAKKRFADETRKVHKEVEGLRSYIESSLQGGNGATPALSIENANGERDDKVETSDNDETEPLRRLRTSKPHHDTQTPPPELQFLQGATSALRTETMNFVHEFQRTKHLTRQLTKKFKTALDRVTELEHQRNEDALKAQELREQRVLSEQAREIVNSEKLEILKWSQQTCEKNEALDEELKKCDRFVQTLLQKLRHRRKSQLEGGLDDGDDEEGDDHRHTARRRKADSSSQVSQHFKTLDHELELLFATQQELRQELEQNSELRSEQQSEIETLRRELEAKTQASEQTMAELEVLHAENAREQRAHFDAVVGELEREKSELTDNLHAANVQRELLTSEKTELQAAVEGFEQDLPVLATVLHLFVLVVQPLVLQVSELLSQKRYLVRENAEYAQAQEQIECIGQVLKELVPTNALHQLVATDRQRHKRFRRVVIAVFALNRFRKCGVLHSSNQPVSGETSATACVTRGSFGTCTSLKAPKKRRSSGTTSTSSSSCSLSSLQRNPPPTVIKVLTPRPTLASLNLHELLERLKQMKISEKVADVIDIGGSDANASVPFFGSLLVQVLSAIDPSAKETLMENTSGAFHCQALLERRRRGAQRHHTKHERDESSENELSTVDLIRKRILALGKRVEDLHFQRNSLQKDNYDFQFQLEQQAAHLKQMDVLLQKTSELQEEMQHMREQSEHEQLQAQQQLDAKSSELELKERDLEAKDDELTQAKAQIQTLGVEISDFQTQLQVLDTEKQELHAEVTKLKLLSIEDEEKAEVAKVGAKKQDEEVRNLKQAARKAHELYQKMNWQLEQEIAERVSLQASVDLLKRQKESLESELHETKLRDLEKSFESDAREETTVDSQTEQVKKKRENRKTQAKKHQRVRFASSHQQQQQHGEDEDDDDVDSSSSSEDREFPASHHHGSSKKSRTAGLALEDTCLYHKYEKPSGLKSPRGFDHSGSRESDDDLLSNSAHHQLSPRATDASSKFLDEWRRLQISSAFDDSDKSRSQLSKPSTSSKAASVVSPTAGATTASTSKQQIAREVEIQSNRRRIEIDKVNSAVHDYMDRIDEKLQQMYGIPPSTSSRVRASGEGDDATNSASEDEDEGARGRAKASAAACAPFDGKRSPSKTDETRPVHWYG